jgi:hypothetical protein
MKTVTDKVISRIYGKGRGWAFSQKDFADLGSSAAIEVALHRFQKKGTIRRVLRGLYDYPRYSRKLRQNVSPDVDQVAQAMARKFGWRIQPSGPAALNILSLSTQIPGQYTYYSDGPDRHYQIGKASLTFENAPLKETGFKYHQSAVLVGAIKSLGKEHIDRSTLTHIRDWLDPKMQSAILKDTRSVSSWIYRAIREALRKGENNG